MIASRLLISVAGSAIALALFGLVRLAFNVITVRAFGAEYVGEVAAFVSSLTVAAVLASSAPGAFATKHVSELLALGETHRAGRVFFGGFVFTLATSLALTPLFAAAFPAPTLFLLGYCPLFALYLFLKGMYFAHGWSASYLAAEIIGVAAFTVTLYVAVTADAPSLAAVSLVLHLAGFCAKALWDHLRNLVPAGAVAEFRQNAPRYVSYLLFSLLNAVTGLGAAHLVIVLAAALMTDRAQIGYFSIVLSALGPLSLIPAAIGWVLFPEVSRLHVQGDSTRIRALVDLSTLSLHVFAATSVGVLILFAPRALSFVGVPATGALLFCWTLLCLDTAASTFSAPSGHYLNATRYAHLQASLGIGLLAISVAVGLYSVERYAIVGAALMRFVATVPLAWGRLALAAGRNALSRPAVRNLTIAHVPLLGLAALSLANSRSILQWACFAALVGAQIPCSRLVFGGLHRFGPHLLSAVRMRARDASMRS
jgi:O-antigen/teichoic acid export membrane protein